ncbi:MAG TPA: GNAT family N-acetyltransferase [Solirubrobacteraceae bacterium]
MTDGPELRTRRLKLRRWLPGDREPFIALNRDPLVMEHFVRVHTPSESARLIERIEHCFEQCGYGLWAVEPADGALAGFVGLWPVPERMPFAPAVELGWRLAPDYWGRGIATEAASAASRFAFNELALGEVLAYTTTTNHRSQRVMQRLGMRNDPAEDFPHPEIPPEHRLSMHVLYRLGAAHWRPRPDMTRGASETPVRGADG